MKLKRPEFFHGYGQKVLGVYAITDALNPSLVVPKIKIGFSTDLVSRLNSYHTYFPNGFWMLSFILVKPELFEKFDMATRKKIGQALEGVILIHLKDRMILNPARPVWSEWLRDVAISELQDVMTHVLHWCAKFWENKSFFQMVRPNNFLHSFHDMYVEGEEVKKFDIKKKLPPKAGPRTNFAGYYILPPIERGPDKRQIQRAKICYFCS